jgi:signal peptidase I
MVIKMAEKKNKKSETKPKTKKEVEVKKEVIKEEKQDKIEIPEKRKYSQEEIDAATLAAKKDMIKEIVPYIIIIAVVVIIRTFIMTPIDVSGESMYPTLHDNDIMLLYKLRLKTVGIRRFDIVVINTDEGKLIKRVIGLPGDKVRYTITKDENDNTKGTLYINGEVVEENFIDEQAKANTCKYKNIDICEKETEIPNGEYYVMGDNRGNSKDSRIIGPVSKKDITGITSFVIFPFSRFGSVK